MIGIQNVLHVVNEVVILPIVIIAFILLIYIVVYLNRKDPDVVRAKIFLNYDKFRKGFLLLSLLGLLLVFHVSLIYLPHYFLLDDYFLVKDMQLFFGLTMAVVMISFVYYLYRSIR